jgi:protein O-mannosyl-transferase
LCIFAANFIKMQRNILFGIGGLILGLAVGFYIANSINRNTVSQPQIAQNQPNTTSMLEHAEQNPQSGMLGDVQENLDKAKNEPNDFAAQMKAGDMYAQIGRFDEAVKFYEAGVKLKPNDLQANLALANSYFDSKQYENAEKHYAKVLEINPKDVNARTDLATTLVERANPDYDRAVKEFQQSLAIDPKHEPTLYNLAVAYFRKGDTENARKTLTQLEQANPNSRLIERLKQIFSQK